MAMKIARFIIPIVPWYKDIAYKLYEKPIAKVEPLEKTLEEQFIEDNMNNPVNAPSPSATETTMELGYLDAYVITENGRIKAIAFPLGVGWLIYRVNNNRVKTEVKGEASKEELALTNKAVDELLKNKREILVLGKDVEEHNFPKVISCIVTKARLGLA